VEAAAMTVRILHLMPHARALGGTERTVLDLLSSPQLAHVEQRVAFAQPGRVLGFPPGAVLGGRGGAAAALPAILRWRPHVLHGWLLQGNAFGAVLKLALPSAALIASERNAGHAVDSALKRQLERAVARAETVATANSAAVRAAAVERVPGRAAHVRVIAPGVAAPLAAAARPATAVMVGRLHPVKDHRTALRAWRRVLDERSDATLTLVGDGPERARLEAQARALGLGGSVRFRGDADPAPDLYGARMFLLTSRAEGFSRAAVEALAAGLPIVATDVGGMAEIGVEAVRIAPVADDAALAGHVLAWLGDPGALARAATAARAAAQRFGTAACHRAYAELYAELAVR
jgi:glycosyltransferase involved in cell wall biosynthesis